MCDTNSAHLPVRAPVDDSNPYCMVGGGWLNLLAGIELSKQHSPKLVVCAYGHRSAYLKELDAPTESEVMSDKLRRVLPNAEVAVWERKRELPGPSNTGRELLNILELAVSTDC